MKLCKFVTQKSQLEKYINKGKKVLEELLRLDNNLCSEKISLPLKIKLCNFRYTSMMFLSTSHGYLNLSSEDVLIKEFVAQQQNHSEDQYTYHFNKTPKKKLELIEETTHLIELLEEFKAMSMEIHHS